MDRFIIQPRRNLRNTGAQNNGPREYIILYASGVVFCSFYKLLDWSRGGGVLPYISHMGGCLMGVPSSQFKSSNCSAKYQLTTIFSANS